MFERYIETKDFLSIPLCGDRYRININGEILCTNTSKLIPVGEDSEGNKLVHLKLWRGLDNYLIVELIARTFKPLFIPVTQWDKVLILAVDGNIRNFHPSNLVWKFPIGLGSKKYPGYAYIPCFSKYVINKNGNIIKHSSSKECSYYISKNGYYCTRIQPDIGKTLIIGRHRLLALAWLDYPVDADNHIVNHIDGKPGNDGLDNLEWATYTRNIDHAYSNGLRTDNKPVLVRNVKTGEVQEYYGVSECARQLGIKAGTCSHRLNNGKGRIYPGYLQFKYKDDPTPWREPEDIEAELNDGRFPKALLMRNYLTKEVTEFKDVTACAKSLSLTHSAIAYRIDSNTSIYPGYLQFKYKDDPTPWREPSVEELEAVRSTKNNCFSSTKPILCRSVISNTITEFLSLRQCEISLGIGYSILLELLNSEQPVNGQGMQFKYKDDPTPWREPEDIESEIDFALYSGNPFAGIAVKCRDIFTGEVKIFRNMTQASKALNVYEEAIKGYIRKDIKRPLLRWDIKKYFDDTPWPEYDQKQLDFYALCVDKGRMTISRGYKCIDILTGEETIYVDRKTICEALNIGKNQLAYYVKYEKVFNNQYTIQYLF